jgi:hypothetical protein
MTDHPEWIWKRAIELVNLQSNLKFDVFDRGPAMRALASLIAKHEQPPVDPDEEVVRVVLQAWWGDDSWKNRGDSRDISDALAAYKALMASRT